jgi:feruloyl esterase
MMGPALMQPLPIPLPIFSNFTSRCLQFEPVTYIANSTVVGHEHVSKGTTLFYPHNDPTCNRPNQTASVDICRIALDIGTSSRSHVLAELWLPETWESHFLATGNGGIDGCTKYEGRK